jgi:hypothetical protein
MASITDYQVLADDVIRLHGNPNANISLLPFELPSDFVVGTKLAKPLLSLIVEPVAIGLTRFPNNPVHLILDCELIHGGDSSPTATAQFRFPLVGSGSFPPEGERLVWQTFDGADFAIGENSFRFSTPFFGSDVRISNIVLWYQRERRNLPDIDDTLNNP